MDRLDAHVVARKVLNGNAVLTILGAKSRWSEGEHGSRDDTTGLVGEPSWSGAVSEGLERRANIGRRDFGCAPALRAQSVGGRSGHSHMRDGRRLDGQMEDSFFKQHDACRCGRRASSARSSGGARFARWRESRHPQETQHAIGGVGHCFSRTLPLSYGVDEVGAQERRCSWASRGPNRPRGQRRCSVPNQSETTAPLKPHSPFRMPAAGHCFRCRSGRRVCCRRT